jgi:hypothetical protein
MASIKIQPENMTVIFVYNSHNILNLLNCHFLCLPPQMTATHWFKFEYTMSQCNSLLPSPSLYHFKTPVKDEGGPSWSSLSYISDHYDPQTKLYSTMSIQLANDSFLLLAETHTVSSSLKVLVTLCTSADLETAWQSMGRHGFSAIAEIGTLWANWVPANMWVLYLRIIAH